MESPDVFSQEELDAALARGDGIPMCAGDGEFVVSGTPTCAPPTPPG